MALRVDRGRESLPTAGRRPPRHRPGSRTGGAGVLAAAAGRVMGAAAGQQHLPACGADMMAVTGLGQAGCLGWKAAADSEQPYVPVRSGLAEKPGLNAPHVREAAKRGLQRPARSGYTQSADSGARICSNARRLRGNQQSVDAPRRAPESAQMAARLVVLSWASFKDEGDLENDLVAGHLSVFYRHFLVLDPRTLDVFQRLVRAVDALDDGVFEALVADAADFGDACDGHFVSPV